MDDSAKSISKSERRALTIIFSAGTDGIRPEAFARQMWPDSRGWQRRTKCGNGVCIGGGMRLAAGGYLGKLRAKGLILSNNAISDLGKSTIRG